MSFTMFIGMISGGLVGALAVAIGLIVAKKKGVPTMVEEDERTELIRARSGSLAFWAVGVVAFVGWVVDNFMRHLKDQPVAFFSPWGIIFFVMIAIYVAALYYESWKLSDNDATPDDAEMKKMQLAMMAAGGSLLSMGSAVLSAGDRLESPVKFFLVSFVLLMALVIGVLFWRMYLKRRNAKA